MSRKPHIDACGRFHHPCAISGCPREGCYGIGVSLLQGRLGQWYCPEHYRELEREPTEQETGEIAPAAPVQRRLF